MYKLARLFANGVTNTFFRDIQVIGQENIPQDGPLLIYGNHNNQFIDPLVIMSSIPRRVNFIAAAKSMRKPIIGDIGKAMGGIPVERPQDLSKTGSGTLIKLDDHYLIGEGTKFIKECQVHDTLLLQGNDIHIQIEEIVNDTKIKISSDNIENVKVNNTRYKIQPKIDQSKMFEQVWLALKEGKCIGIFPEGGSHDNTTLLPLKPGICIMALGASQKYKVNVKLQPVGLNYYKGHKFRSKVVVEFGTPYEISEELIAQYAINKRQTISTLLEEIEQQLKSVTIQAPSYSHLSAVMLARILYLPDRTRLTPSEMLDLTRRFSSSFYKLKDHPEVNQTLTEIKMYNYKLKSLGVRDWEVMRMHKRIYLDLQFICFHIFMTILCLLFAFPGYIMTVPITMILQIYAEKERRTALAGSRVKIYGKDVVASFKVLAAIIIVPIAVLVYTFLFYLWLLIYDIADDHRLKLTLTFLLSWPLYITAMIRSNDGLIRHARKVNSQIRFYFHEHKYKKLKKLREQLQIKIRKYVDEFGDEVIPDLQNHRIVQKEQLLRRESSLDPDSLDVLNIFDALKELGI